MGPFGTRAVFFDVDFTLIHPGPTFQGAGYRTFCEKYGISVDPARFDQAVANASSVLDEVQHDIYDPQLFIAYTRRIIEQMGGTGDNLDVCATEIYEEWAVCQHFSLYEEVPEVLRQLHDADVRIGLISNSHRCLASFQSHFALDGLFAAAVSSSLHGYMKPHPSIFEAALQLVGVLATESVMVGDSLKQDIEGARSLGMRGVLVCRSGRLPSAPHPDVPVVRTLTELTQHL